MNGIPPSESVETLHRRDAPVFWIKVEVNVPDPSGISPQYRSGCYATASFNVDIMLTVLWITVLLKETWSLWLYECNIVYRPQMKKKFDSKFKTDLEENIPFY